MKHYGILATSNNHTLNCFDFLAQFLSFQSIKLSGSTCCLTQSGCHCQPFQSCLCQHKYKNYYEMANTNELKGIFVDFLSQINFVLVFFGLLLFYLYISLQFCVLRSLFCTHFCIQKLFWFVLPVCFRNREKEGMKLGRQGGSGKSWGKRNGDQNIKNLFSITKLNILILGNRPCGA